MSASGINHCFRGPLYVCAPYSTMFALRSRGSDNSPEARMPNWTSLQLSPTHLGLFLLDRRTGGPLTRVPVYAEAAWTARTPQPPPDNRFYELVGSELWKLDEPCADDNACRTRTEAAFAAALPQLLTSRARSALLADGSRARELFRDAIAQLLESEQVASVNDIPAADLD